MAGKVRLGLAGISLPNFWGFKESQYNSRAARLRDVCRELGAGLSVVPRTFQDAEGAVRAARVLNEKADLAVLDVATFPEGKAAGAFFEALTPPAILWSRGESVHGTHIGHNSFCGANFLAGNLALKGRRVRHVYGQCSGREFRARLSAATKLVAAARLAANSRIGLFGEGVVPKFFDIDVAPADRRTLERRWGIRFVPVPTKRLVERARRYKEAKLAKVVEEFARHFKTVEVPPEAVLKQVRVLCAIRDISSRERFASIAVRCWPELQEEMSLWPCPSLGTLN